MFFKILIGIMIPFFGTLIGAFGVFFIKKEVKPVLERVLSALAGGIMSAASIWSLIIPSLELNSDKGFFQISQTVIGFMIGIVAMLWADKKVKELFLKEKSIGFTNSKTAVQFIAVTLHNIPEGMAVGMVYSALMTEKALSGYSAALILSLGIAIQNIPEGAIISMPLYSYKTGKMKAFLSGALSGIVEPIGAVLAIIASQSVGALLPFFLSFAAGAMIFVVTEQLIPEMYSENDSKNSLMTVLYSVGFLLMMSLDVLFG